MARHLYNFFVADEVQVPSWQDEPPRDPEAIAILCDALVSSNYDIRETLRVLFKSDFFKDESVWFEKVKSPTELVVSTMRLTQDFKNYRPWIFEVGMEPSIQGQAILNPPSVEGWHTGPGVDRQRRTAPAHQLRRRQDWRPQLARRQKHRGETLRSGNAFPVGPRRRMPGPAGPYEGRQRHPQDSLSTTQPLKETCIAATRRRSTLLSPTASPTMLKLITSCREYQLG